MQTLAFIAEIFRKYRVWMMMTTSLVILTAIVDAASIITLAPVIEIFTGTTQEFSGHLAGIVTSVLNIFDLPVNIVSFLLLLLLFSIFQGILHIGVEWLTLRIQFKVVSDIILGTFNSVFNARWSFFAESKQGTLLNTFTNEVNRIGNAFYQMALMFSKIFQMVIFFLLPFYISWQVTSLVVISGAVFFVPFLFFGKISRELGKKYTDAANRVGQVLQQSLGSAKVILGFGNQRWSYRNLEKNYSDQIIAQIKSKIFVSSIKHAYGPLVIVVMAIALFATMKFQLAVSDSAVLLFALYRASPFFGELLTRKHKIDNFQPSYLQIKNIKRKAREMEQVSGERKFKGINEGIKTESLNFSYPDHDTVLKDINVEITKGKMIAITGESGAGKSTLIDIIMGFHEPLSGKIMIDGISLFDFDILAYRKRIGYVPQECILFNISIMDNLRWAKEDATIDEAREACRLANANDFIVAFPEGYETIVGDRGVRLSGGQAQRISLARAIIRKPELLILDEATSSLDSQSEQLIQQSLENITKVTTTLVIAHRLSTIRNADYIYVLSEGHVVEEGTYSELVEMNSYFAKMVEAQIIGYEEIPFFEV